MLNRLFGFLGWFGSLLVFAAVAVWFIRPDLELLRRTLAFAGLACTLLYGATQWRQVARSFNRRQTRYGTLAGTGLLLVVAIVAGLNYVLARRTVRWDLTAARQYSLSDQTRQIIDSLSAPVRILVFARELEFPQYEDRLNEYAYQSSQITVDYIDADGQPSLTRQYEVQNYGTIVFEYEGRLERVQSDAEQDLTNALIKVIEGEQQTVYFLQGHGEREPEGSDRTGYSTVSEALGLDNYQVEPLLLAQQGTVPDDATVVVAAGPQTDLLQGEVDALAAYLDGGGKLLVLLDPPADGSSPGPDLLFGLLRGWGIDVGNDVVVDASGVGQLFGGDATVPVAANYPFHPITDEFNLLTAFPLARSISAVAAPPEGRTPQAFIQTSAQSWAEADFTELAGGEVAMDEQNGDRPGPVAIGMTVSAPAPAPNLPPAPAEAPSSAEDALDAGEDAPTPETRLAVIGDSDFATNGAVGIQGNRDLFLNTVSWLAQQDTLISIRPREAEDRRITLTADQQRRVFWLAILFIPAAALGTGVYTWWRRR